MKKFIENLASKFTWNRAYWTAIIASWILMTASWLIPDPYAFAMLAPILGTTAFAVFAGLMWNKERKNRETDSADHTQS